MVNDQAYLVNSYTLTLLGFGSSSSSTATLFYNDQALTIFESGGGFPNFENETDTAYPITVSNLPVAAAPEIAVSGSIGGAVTDGGTSAQGNQLVGTPVTVTYTVQNIGNADLALGALVDFAPSGVTVDNVTFPASSSVAGGGSTTFEVTYTPTAAGPFSFGLSLDNGDSDEMPFDFTVSGTGVAAPALTLSAVPSASEQTAGRDYSFTLTPGAAAGGGPTTDLLTLTMNLPAGHAFRSGSGTGWTCGVSSQRVTCTTPDSIAAGTTGNPVTITVTPSAANAGFEQVFNLSTPTGFGPIATVEARASLVTVNGPLQTSRLIFQQIFYLGEVVNDVGVVSYVSGGTAPFSWSVSPSLPAGLTLDTVTGTISGAATAQVSRLFRFTLTDARGATSFQDVFLISSVRDPQVTGVSPAAGPTAGGTVVTITGTNLATAVDVSFGTTQVPASSFISISDTQIVVPAPPAWSMSRSPQEADPVPTTARRMISNTGRFPLDCPTSSSGTAPTILPATPRSP